ncbi:DUF4340 domain-containing protein [Silvanigrella aquatica]|uniref:DUF4340 domain-containing protein n=1 Tax=Silvanigrella aquatica TaxID=1915309 RepID=A0A1L4D372_9BACT|nr:DUF4340 domain-containing protein [Silvanigrella aquatica]APJ04656.1 hypothetical protein AXG55_12380 [Silvanigrella aquatica]
MKFSMKVSLGLLAIIALSGIYYGDNYFSEKKAEHQKEVSFAIFFETKDVLKFALKNSNGVFTFARDTNESPWKILTPSLLSADQDAVNNILAAIQQLAVLQEVPNTEKTLTGDKKALAQFGLENPKTSLSVNVTGKGEMNLFLGSPLDIGKGKIGSSTATSLYAINPAKSKLLVVSNSLSSVIENKNLYDFRTKRVGDFKGENVSSIEINYNNENILVTKNNNSWEVTKPVKWPGDINFISDYLSRFQGLLAQKVFEHSELTSEMMSKFNLTKPTAVVQLKDSNGKILQTFNLGITKEGVYSSMRDGAVAKISLDLWAELIPKEKLFRNRLVMLNTSMDSISRINLSSDLSFVRKDNNWFRTLSTTQQPPVSETPNSDAFSFFSNWELMTADDMILNPTNEDLVQFGITKPLKEFSFGFTEVSKLKPIKIIVGNRVPKNEKNVYLKRSDSPTVYIVEAGWLSLLAQLYSVGVPSNISVKKQME